MSIMQLSITIGGDTMNRQYEKSESVHWEGSMFVAIPLPLSLTLM